MTAALSTTAAASAAVPLAADQHTIIVFNLPLYCVHVAFHQHHPTLSALVVIFNASDLEFHPPS